MEWITEWYKSLNTTNRVKFVSAIMEMFVSEEQKEKLKREYLKAFYDKGYRYIATDTEGWDWVFVNKPQKGPYYWGQNGKTEPLFVKLGLTSWDDTEPFNIAKYLTEKKNNYRTGV